MSFYKLSTLMAFLLVTAPLFAADAEDKNLLSSSISMRQQRYVPSFLTTVQPTIKPGEVLVANKSRQGTDLLLNGQIFTHLPLKHISSISTLPNGMAHVMGQDQWDNSTVLIIDMKGQISRSLAFSDLDIILSIQTNSKGILYVGGYAIDKHAEKKPIIITVNDKGDILQSKEFSDLRAISGMQVDSSGNLRVIGESQLYNPILITVDDKGDILQSKELSGLYSIKDIQATSKGILHAIAQDLEHNPIIAKIDDDGKISDSLKIPSQYSIDNIQIASNGNLYLKGMLNMGWTELYTTFEIPIIATIDSNGKISDLIKFSRLHVIDNMQIDSNNTIYAKGSDNAGGSVFTVKNRQVEQILNADDIIKVQGF